MSKSGYEFAKAIIAKNKAIISAAKNQNKKEVAKIVRTPARSYKKSNNRSRSRGISGSSSSNSSKTDSGNVNQGVTTQNQGSNAPPGFQAPPPPTNTVYDYISRDNNTNISDPTLKKIEDAPQTPIQTKNEPKKNETLSRNDFVQETYTQMQTIDQQLSQIQQQKQDIDPQATYLIDKKVNGNTEP